MIYESAPKATGAVDTTGNPSESRGSKRPAREASHTETTVTDNLSEAEQAVWRDLIYWLALSQSWTTPRLLCRSTDWTEPRAHADG